MAKTKNRGKKGNVAVTKANKKPLKVDSKTSQKPTSPLLAAMGKELRVDTKASMFGGDMQRIKSRLVQLEEAGPGDTMRSYYKDMVLRCVKCDGSFNHKTDLPLMEYQIKCPHCNEAHVLKFKPASRLFTVQSNTVDVLDSKD
jgi:hypothetical protein